MSHTMSLWLHRALWPASLRLLIDCVIWREAHACPTFVFSFFLGHPSHHHNGPRSCLGFHGFMGPTSPPSQLIPFGPHIPCFIPIPLLLPQHLTFPSCQENHGAPEKLPIRKYFGFIKTHLTLLHFILYLYQMSPLPG